MCIRPTIRRPLSSAMALVIGAGISLSLVHRAEAQSQTTQGSWSTLPYTMPINPLHAGLMRSGKVVIVAGSENDVPASQQQVSLAAVWNPQTGTITVQNLQWDVFCNGGACFPDGRFLIVGGTDQYDPFYGEARTTVFDPATEKFNDVENMVHGRWYATVTALNDGRLMTFSGLNELGNVNNAVEIYTVGSGWSPEYIAPWTPPLYPWLHLLPNGKVFYSGDTPSSSIFDPATKGWTMNVANTVYNNTRLYGSSVLLPLMPSNGYAPRVMIMGGHDPDATATAEIIDLSVPNPAWRMIAPMSKPRIEMNAVMLPNGKVLALGGSATNEDATTASLQADLFNPATETWSPAGVEAYARLYHSVALLLPDATVWVAGSNPSRGIYEPHMEIYMPPYLYTTNAGGTVIAAPRPTITAVPSEIGYGGTFSIQTTNAAAISSAVLIRPGAPTHAFDMEQRLIGLTFSVSNSMTLTATAPPNGSIAPPGYYMLFILNSSGVPSVAKFVHLTATPTDQPPKGTITSPTGDVTIQEGQSISFDCDATDPDGTVASYSWILPEGTPDASSQQHPGSVTFSNAGIYVVSMTAIDNAGVNDPSPPTRTIRVQPPGLVAAYSFDEGSGTTVADSSSNNNAGAISGATWTTSGKYDSALSFNGTSALVTIPDSASLRLTSAMTLEAWVFPTTVTPAWRDVIYKGNDNYYLEGTSNPSGAPATGGSTIGGALRGPAALTANIWTHLAATYDGATLRLYVNGVQVASRAQTGSIATSTNPLQIGGDSIFGQYFAGLIDEVRLYSRALSASEIQADMIIPIGGFPSAPGNLVATPVSTNQINLSWSASTDKAGIAAYLVERQALGGTNFVRIATAAGTNYNDTGLTANTNYSYRVQATNTVGHVGPYSNVAQAYTGFLIGPQVVVLTTTRTQQFTPSFGDLNIIWSVDGVVGGSASSGTITAAGLYSPPSDAGAHTVTATSSDQTQSASATVYVSVYPGTFTYHNDNLRTGQNLNETVLTPARVNSTTFGKLYSYQLDGMTFASPLYVANLNIPGKGFHNVVFAETEHDSVYAFDADGLTNAPLWQRSFINPAAGVTTVPAADTQETNDIPNEIGITSTPVIDPTSNSIYVVAETKEVSGNVTNYVKKLHALDITTGAEMFGGPVVIQGSVVGTGLGSQGGHVAFLPLRENQRTGLLLLNGVVYFAFASHGDYEPFHGWVMGYNATNLQQVLLYCSTPNGDDGGIWMNGCGLAADSTTNLYFLTGNGLFDANTGGNDYGDCFVKMSLAGTVLDYFSPSNQGSLNTNDLDLGSGGVLLLPDQSGPHPHEMLSGGKGNGPIYLVDRDNMGHYNPSNNNQIVQSIPNVFPAGNFGSPIYHNGFVYVCGANDHVQAFQLSNGLLTTNPTSRSSATYAGRGATLAISANGSANGILWTLQSNGTNSPGVLHAYNASNLSNELYNSSQAGSRDTLDAWAKFSLPLAANGKVFVSSVSQLTVYGLLPIGTVAPPAASFTATPTNGVAPLNVAFTDTSIGSPTSWLWMFGDTGTSTSQNPSNTYKTPGSYTVRLIASNAGGSSTNTQSNYIFATNPPSPVAAFSANPTNGPAPLPVTFTDSSTGSISNWFWNFGDGNTTNFAVQTNPGHTYAAGTYNVSLTVSGLGGTNTSTQSNYVVALNPAHLVVNPGSLNFGSVTIGQTNSLNFSAINTGEISLSGTATSAAPFTVTSGSPYNLAGGQTQTVTVAFAPGSSGSFNASVIFASTGGNSTNAVSGVGLTPGSIAVTPAALDFGVVLAGTTAQASFVVTNSGGTAVSNGTATVTSGPFTIVSGAAFSVPGFGATNVTVQFAPVSVGGFTNSVLFATANGGSASNTVSGTGAIVPVASFTGSPTNGTEPLLVTFTDTSIGTITNSFWDFGDSSTTNVTTNIVAHTYAAGVFTVTLVASGPAGISTNIQANYITVLTAFQSWQQQYFGCTGCPQAAPDADPLGKGMSNTNQFLAGLNPANPAAYLHIISIVATNTADINVIYLGSDGDSTYVPGVASRTNVLEFTTGAADGSYASDNFASTGQTNILSGGTGLGVVTNMVDTGGATNIPSRYYRVRVLVP